MIVRPSLEYCSSQCHSKSMEKVQQWLVRWTTGRYHNISSVTDMLNDLMWRDLAQRRVNSRLTMMFDITRGLVDTPIGYCIKFHRGDVHLQPINARVG